MTNEEFCEKILELEKKQEIYGKKNRVFVGDSLDVYENIAFEYGLLKSCPDDALRIFLWSNDRTVVIGKIKTLFQRSTSTRSKA